MVKMSNNVGILFGVFYGMAADRYGRRPILVLALAGMTMATAWAQMICTIYPSCIEYYLLTV